ncbi:RING zinc finger protein-like [Rhynchospora pubera]|uniref:RING-type E3 ubiquitin transferase n=1 Tax=Rhynchospora pubera TaxID=906938 RepID=A0AAV8HLI0_9POAL|nr:RING zinc finger protein-like [Rhynchospora pubera]
MHGSLFRHLLSVTTDPPLTASSPLSPPPPLAIHPPPFTPFRPSIAVIVGILTTLFSLTFLLLLYARHCKRSDSTYSPESTATYGFPSGGDLRRHSGVGRAVVESLPVIRFGALKGEKDGLECAVCLGRFEPAEVLRILPKCKHGFHVECVDTWLDAHSTCPLCRVRPEPEDILISVDTDPSPNWNPKPNPNPTPKDCNTDLNCAQAAPGRRVSGRYSTGSLQIGQTRSGSNRRSVDAVGCFDIGKVRKDRVLLPEPGPQDREAFERRFSHRIVVGDGEGTVIERWSDLRPSDLVLLRSDERLSQCGGRQEINGRSLSEITGVSRLAPSRFGAVPRRVEEERWLRNWLGLAAQRTAKWLRGPPSDNGPSS